MFEIRLEEWIKGTAHRFKTVEVASKDEGLTLLRVLGKGKWYTSDVAGYLVDPDGATIAILNIYDDLRFKVEELA